MTKFRCQLGLVILAMAALVLPATLHAQTPAVSGRVVDEQGGAVAGADVRLLRSDGASARSTRSDATGTYRFDGVTSGVFIIQIDRAGFRRHVAPIEVEGVAAIETVTLTVAGIEDSIVVTGAGLPQSTSEVSKAVSIVSKQEIAERNEATLTEIVRFTPGVQVRDNGGPGQFATMRIRGVRPDAGAILVDGMRLRDASTTQGDAGSFMSNFNFVGAERVEVLRGSGAALFGTNAVGGAVNIVTAVGGSPFRGDAQVEAGSQGMFRARGVVNGGGFDNKLAYSVGGLQWNVTDGLDGDDAARSSGWQGMLRYQLSPVTSLTGRVYGSDDRVALNSSATGSGIPAANVPDQTIVDAIPVDPEAIDRFNAGQPLVIGNATFIPGRNDPDSRRTSWFATNALLFQHAQSDRVSWQASYQRVHTNRVFLNGPLGPGFQAAAESFGNYVGDIDTVDGRAILLPAPWLDVTAGYEFEREGYFDRQDNNLPGTSRVATQTRIAQHANTGYAAANLALAGRRLQLSLAGRLQTFALKPVELSAVGTDNAYARTELESPAARADRRRVPRLHDRSIEHEAADAHRQCLSGAGVVRAFRRGFFDQPHDRCDPVHRLRRSAARAGSLPDVRRRRRSAAVARPGVRLGQRLLHRRAVPDRVRLVGKDQFGRRSVRAFARVSQRQRRLLARSGAERRHPAQRRDSPGGVLHRIPAPKRRRMSPCPGSSSCPGSSRTPRRSSSPTAGPVASIRRLTSFTAANHTGRSSLPAGRAPIGIRASPKRR